jgi:hypothetical protein
MMFVSQEIKGTTTCGGLLLALARVVKRDGASCVVKDEEASVHKSCVVVYDSLGGNFFFQFPFLPEFL